MKSPTKIILTIATALVVLTILLLSTVFFYYYTHAGQFKTLVEKLVSRSVGAPFTIQQITYSGKPRKLVLQGIHLGAVKEPGGSSLHVSRVAATVLFQGKWGRRVLVLKNVQVSGFSSRILGSDNLARFSRKTVKPSFSGSFLRTLFGYFFFRKLKLQSAEILNGQVSAQLDKGLLRINHIRAKLKKGHPVDIFCDISAVQPSQNINLAIPSVYLKVSQKLSIDDLQIGGSCLLKGISFDSPFAGVRNLEIKLGFL